MALEKVIKNINGSETTYHKIINVSYDFLNDKITVLVASYKNQEMRDKEKKIAKSRIEASNLYQLLNSTDITLDQREAYETKLDKLLKTLENTNQSTYYVNAERIDLGTINKSFTIKSIYKRLNELEQYSDAKEV